MKKLLTLIFIALSVYSRGQSFSFSDTTIIFKDASGKVLNQEEIKSITSNTFNIKKEKEQNGKKVYVLVPVTNEQLNKRKTEINAYKNSLINKNLPPFSFRDINNKLWDLQSLKGKTIVLNFWFTNCDPCLREIPFLNKIVEDNNSNNIVFIAISYSDKKSIIHSNHKFPFKYHLIPNQLKYISQLQISEYPTSIIVNSSGLIKYVSVGFNEEIYKELKNALKDLAN